MPSSIWLENFAVMDLDLSSWIIKAAIVIDLCKKKNENYELAEV